jgi:hypothetical protein
MKNNNLFTVILLSFLLMTAACKKQPGPGGKATIKGRVYAKDFNNTNSYLLGQYYAPGEHVYICYGTGENVDSDLKTSADGSFTFRFLSKGHYKVFVTSLDTSIHVKGADKELPVIKEVDITGISQTVDLGDFVINR